MTRARTTVTRGGVSRALTAALLVLSLAVSSVLGGHRFFLCEPMGAVLLEACCHASHADAEGDDLPSVSPAKARCCTKHHFAKLGYGTAERTPRVAEASVIALPPTAPAWVDSVAPFDDPRSHPPSGERWGPVVLRSGAPYRARIQVFLL